FSCSCSRPVLPSFPTRRSSDLLHVDYLYAALRTLRTRFRTSHRLLDMSRIPLASGSLLFAVARDRRRCDQRYNYQENFHENLLRSEEHTSELQSRENLVCRLLL